MGQTWTAGAAILMETQKGLSVGYEVISPLSRQMFCQKCVTSHALAFFTLFDSWNSIAGSVFGDAAKEEHFMRLILEE